MLKRLEHGWKNGKWNRNHTETPFNSSTAIKLAGPHKRLTNITYRSAIPSCHEMLWECSWTYQTVINIANKWIKHIKTFSDHFVFSFSDIWGSPKNSVPHVPQNPLILHFHGLSPQKLHFHLGVPSIFDPPHPDPAPAAAPHVAGSRGPPLRWYGKMRAFQLSLGVPHWMFHGFSPICK